MVVLQLVFISVIWRKISLKKWLKHFDIGKKFIMEAPLTKSPEADGERRVTNNTTVPKPEITSIQIPV